MLLFPKLLAWLLYIDSHQLAFYSTTWLVLCIRTASQSIHGDLSHSQSLINRYHQVHVVTLCCCFVAVDGLFSVLTSNDFYQWLIKLVCHQNGLVKAARKSNRTTWLACSLVSLSLSTPFPLSPFPCNRGKKMATVEIKSKNVWSAENETNINHFLLHEKSLGVR